jgi:hypothetical protein
VPITNAACSIVLAIELCMYRNFSGLASNTLAAAIMPSYPSVSSTMQRDRRANPPPLPARRQDLQIEIPFATMSAGDRFLLSCDPNNDYIIFATDAHLSRLCASPVVCVDATFDVVPNLFVQLYTFHAFVGDQWRTQKFSKEGASAAYFSNFTAWLMAIMLCTTVRNMQQKV